MGGFNELDFVAVVHGWQIGLVGTLGEVIVYRADQRIVKILFVNPGAIFCVNVFWEIVLREKFCLALDLIVFLSIS